LIVFQPDVSAAEPTQYANANSYLTSAAVVAPNAVATKVYRKAQEVFENAVDVSYMHLHEGAKNQVQRMGSGYEVSTDCSGFASYVLDSVAPAHYAAIRERTERSYPQAKTYAEFFHSLNRQRAEQGWLGLGSFKDLACGDLIAWEKPVDPDSARRGNTGHVLIVAGSPSGIKVSNVGGEVVRYVEIPAIDSSSVWHFPPEQLPPLAHQQHRNGVGKGTVRLVLDPADNIIGYWEGTYWGEGGREITHPTYTDMIGLARLVPLQQRLAD
jgi:hypothetical protein